MTYQTKGFLWMVLWISILLGIGYLISDAGDDSKNYFKSVGIK